MYDSNFGSIIVRSHVGSARFDHNIATGRLPALSPMPDSISALPYKLEKSPPKIILLILKILIIKELVTS